MKNPNSCVPSRSIETRRRTGLPLLWRTTIVQPQRLLLIVTRPPCLPSHNQSLPGLSPSGIADDVVFTVRRRASDRHEGLSIIGTREVPLELRGEVLGARITNPMIAVARRPTRLDDFLARSTVTKLHGAELTVIMVPIRLLLLPGPPFQSRFRQISLLSRKPPVLVHRHAIYRPTRPQVQQSIGRKARTELVAKTLLAARRASRSFVLAALWALHLDPRPPTR